MPRKEENFASRFRNRARKSYELVGDKVEDVKDGTREVIKERPLTSVIIAAAIGAIVGVGVSEMIRRARQRDRKSFIKRLRRMF